MPATGGEPWLLLGDDGSWPTCPVWSADDRRVVFESRRGGSRNLWDIDLDSRRLRQLTAGPGADTNPAVSRTGRLAYSEFRMQRDLYQTAIDGSGERRLTSTTNDNFGARLSPDGKKLAYHSNRTGNYEVWLLDLETGAERQLTDHPALDGAPDWSPDGREIVFASNRQGGDFHPWVMDTEGRILRRLAGPSLLPMAMLGFPAARPRWAPDGLAIGYIAASGKGPALWVIDPRTDKGRPRLFGLNSFEWYRESRHVVYTRAAGDGGWEMRVADLETGREAPLFKGAVVELAVARDGGAVAYTHAVSYYDMQLYVLKLVPPASPAELPGPLGETRQITRSGPWHVNDPAWTPDGRALIYTRSTYAGDIYVTENYF